VSNNSTRISNGIDAAKDIDGGMHLLMQKLIRDDGKALATLSNGMLILSGDPNLRGMLGYDEFSSQHLLMRAPPVSEAGDMPLPGPYPRPWTPADVAYVQAYLQRVHAPRYNRQNTEDAMLAEAEKRRFHPVRDWLNGLKWDGFSRIDEWLSRAFGAPKDSYTRAVGAKFLIAAVRRVRQPGCKFDTVPVLEGGQGIGKSRAVKALFGESWFSDAMPDDLAGKDAAMALLGVWGLEWGEIEQLIRSEPETVKAFLSRGVDRYRPPYGKAYIERPRQGVLIGTTNAQDYLRDITGNRRIWPISCQHADPDWVAENREQLWAEAAARERAGEALWIDDEEAQKTAVTAQNERMIEDVWTDHVRKILFNRTYVTVAEILSHLNVPRERQGKREQMRVGAILTSEGWKRRSEWSGSKTYRVWRLPAPENPTTLPLPEAPND
jgi:putative DNA primase/helicase